AAGYAERRSAQALHLALDILVRPCLTCGMQPGDLPGQGVFERGGAQTAPTSPDLPTSGPSPFLIDEDENRFPRQLAFARCSCKGCIDTKNGRETTNLNSVEVKQRTMVFRRKACPPNGSSVERFFFEKDYVEVPVACTCAVPRYSN
uniref:Interleukin 17C n=1 Tax=Laticauda laticaudata TaxID=8630 RepID=A0A8C5RZA7_LATLA